MKVYRNTRANLGAAVNRFIGVMYRHDAGRTLPLLHAAGLTTPQVALLDFVREPRTISSIALHLGLSLPATSQIADKLARSRLILRKEGSEDRRQRFVVLSAKGQALVERIAAARAARFADSLAHLTPAIAARFESALAEVLNALEQPAPQPSIPPAKIHSRSHAQ